MADDNKTNKDAEKADNKNEDKPKIRNKKGDSSISHIVELSGGVQVDSTKRLAAMDVGPIEAYEGFGDKSGEQYFALVCEPDITPRVRASAAYQNISNPRLSSLVKRGVVYWPPARQERYMLVFQNNLGQSLSPADQKQALGLHQDIVLEKILEPLANCLLDFRDKEFFHGGIRASNLFNGGTANLESVMLGQALAAPSSFMQPVLYETIQRAMADPIARGRGRQCHDLYALGITLAVMLRSNDPMEGLSSADIIKHKLEVGSYAAVTGKDRFKGSILELLRGLLHDEDDQRWSVEEMQEWIDGQRLTPKQVIPRKKADRPLLFAGERYFQLEKLAMDLEVNPTETKRIIDEGDLEQWLVRSMNNEELNEHLTEMIAVVRNNGQGAGYQDRLVSVLSMVLDPAAPIRYKGLHMNPEGIGTALSQCMAKKQDVSVFADLLSQGIPMQWIKEQLKAGIESGIFPQNFEMCARFLRKPHLGLGIERCLYQLNPESHCLSEKLEKHHVLSAEELLIALDNACKGGMAPALFIDRHIAAFLSAQDANYIDDLLPMLNAQEYHKRIVANLRCFANIQRRDKIGALPHLAKAFAELMPTVYKRYHDQEIREKMQKQVGKLAAAGDLVKMIEEVDSPAVANKDFKAFKLAMYDHKVLSAEHAELARQLENKKTFGLSAGRQIAALISCGLAGFVILGLTFSNFF